MADFPDRLTCGAGGDGATYVLAEGHYLIRTRHDDAFSVVESFADAGLMSAELPAYIEAARATLEPAGLRWVELAPGLDSADAERAMAANAGVEAVLPVYFEAGAGPETAATPVFETFLVQISEQVDAVRSRVEAMSLSYHDGLSQLLEPTHLFQWSPADGNPTPARANELKQEIERIPGVRSVDFDWLKLETYASAPDDTYYDEQWSLHRIDFAGARAFAEGSPGVWIAVVDGGFDLDHPDLGFTPNSSPWYSHLNVMQLKAGKPPPYDAGRRRGEDCHATQVAGIAAARTDNARGVAGAGNGCSIMPISDGGLTTSAHIAGGIVWAALKGARVINLSVVCSPTDAAKDALQKAWAQGVVICAGAGNYYPGQGPVTFPARHPRVIAVGASTRDDLRKDHRAGEEEWASGYGPELDVVAPGVNIWTTDDRGRGDGLNWNGGGPQEVYGVEYPSSGDEEGEYYSLFHGTSAATPHVAGLAGLIISANPKLTNEKVREIIETTCTKVRRDRYDYAVVPGRPHGEWNEEMGYGLIDAEAAVKVAAGAIQGGDRFYLEHQSGRYIAAADRLYPTLANVESGSVQFEFRGIRRTRELESGDEVQLMSREDSLLKQAGRNVLLAWNDHRLYYWTLGYHEKYQGWKIIRMGDRRPGDVICFGDKVAIYSVGYSGQRLCESSRFKGYLTTAKNDGTIWYIKKVPPPH